MAAPTDEEAPVTVIIVVDDDPLMRHLVRHSLEPTGAIVMEAENGHAGLELMARYRPDLVLLDVMMPVMNGYETCRAMRESPDLREIPVVIATGLEDMESIDRAYQVGATDFVVKPINWVVFPHHVNFIVRAGQTMRRLKESEERFALAARGANDGLWDWNLETATIYYSPRWEKMLGFPEGTLSNSLREWFQRVHPEDLARLSHDLDAHLSGQTEHFENEHRIRAAGNSYHWMLCRGLAIRDASGKPSRIAGSQTDITLRKRAESQLLYDASHDALTGLPNRLLLLDRLSHAIKLAQRRPDYLFAIMFLDLDRFKIINDSLGHQVGDDLLIEISRRIQGCIRENDTLARLGGDEFVLLLDDLTDPGFVTEIATRIQSSVADLLSLNGHEIRTSASIGIAYASPRYKLPEDMLRDADTAMYRAKKLGKARYVVFDEAMHMQAMNAMMLEMEIRAALAEKQFLLCYQPIVSLAQNRIVGFEALLRWQHPARGTLLPEQFLNVAEESGLIVPVGRWVLDEACRQMRGWLDKLPQAKEWFVSINISPPEFFQSDFVESIDQALERAGLDVAHLKLEFTERVLLSNGEQVRAKLMQLSQRGIQITVDDFGASYSAFSYLNDLPIDFLKIDRSVFHALEDDKEKLEVVGAIVGLAHNLKLSVVAEGSETSGEVEALKSLSCEYGQGNYFQEPASAGDLLALIHQDGTAGQGSDGP